MDYKVFYRKYRPDSFKNIIGQNYSKTMLLNAIKKDKISHAYLFTGPRGTGKTSTAKVFAKAINCKNPIDGEACGECSSCKNFKSSADIIEIDAASNNGVDEIRELINNIKIAPSNSKYKIYIIDEVHMMTTSAFNALLLTLEEPPKHVVFIMATTNVESVPITILSRCQRFDFKKLTIEELQGQIDYVCERENIQISAEACLEIAYIAEGGMRDALSLLDQLSATTNNITIEDVLSNYGSISTVFIKNIVQNLLNNDVVSLIKQFDDLKSSANDYKIFIKKLIQELVNYAIKLKTEFLTSKFSYEQVKKLIFELNDCMNRANINVNPYILIELILLDFVDVQNISNANDKKAIDTNNKQLSDFLEKKEVNIPKFVQEDNLLSNLEDIKKIRINNCFCEANKEQLNHLKLMWQDVSSSPIPDDILNLLVDCDIVASSKTNVILATELSSTATLINCRICEIDDYLCEFFGQELKFITLTNDEWKNKRTSYISNIKRGITYTYQEEKVYYNNNEKILEEKVSLEKVAQELFEHDKIEIV